MQRTTGISVTTPVRVVHDDGIEIPDDVRGFSPREARWSDAQACGPGARTYGPGKAKVMSDKR